MATESEPPDTPSRFGRRRFLIAAGAAGVAGLAAAAVADHPWSGAAASSRASAPKSAAVRAGTGVLVLVTLYGGNDGLNTVVPATDSAYQAGRPTLGYQPDEVLPLADGLGLNPQLKGMKALWDARHLAVVRGVGYPDPSLSHFQSMDIWQTASVDGSGSGWLGRWLDATGTDPMRAISVGAALPPALRGTRSAATAVTGTTITLPGRPAFQTSYAALGRPGADRSGLAAQVAASGADLLAVQHDLAELAASGHPPASAATPTSAATAAGAAPPTSAATSTSAATPTNAATPAGVPGADKAAGATTLSGQLAIVAALIAEGAPTRVYQVSLASFDTHADEKATHERLLAELDAGVSSFFAALGHTPRGAGVVLMTYSEFGRRVAQNASGGTDHGTAAPLFVAGSGVRGGQFYGEEPSLTALDQGDLRYSVDFRSVYATMLDRVVGVDPRPFLGGSFPTLDLI